MVAKVIDGVSGWLEPFPIHFDVPEHFIPLELFIETAEAVSKIAENLNEEVFSGQIEYHLLVLPAEDGSFKTKLAIFVTATLSGLWIFVESDVGQAFIKGLTGQKPEYWAEIAGSEVREQLLSDEDVGTVQEHEGEKDKCAAAKLLTSSTRGILENSSEQIARTGVSGDSFDKAIEGRNDFFESCIAVEDLRAVGFADEPKFPIDRAQFVDQIIVSREPEEEDNSWKVEITDLTVTSPNWDRSDKHRLWKGKAVGGTDRYFKIEDEAFWLRVERNEIQPKVLDSIRVQWAYRIQHNKMREIRVLRILMYNGKAFSQPLDPEALAAILGRFSQHSSANAVQPDLFSP
jgi:hypothetical protein